MVLVVTLFGSYSNLFLFVFCTFCSYLDNQQQPEDKVCKICYKSIKTRTVAIATQTALSSLDRENVFVATNEEQAQKKMAAQVHTTETQTSLSLLKDQHLSDVHITGKQQTQDGAARKSRVSGSDDDNDDDDNYDIDGWSGDCLLDGGNHYDDDNNRVAGYPFENKQSAKSSKAGGSGGHHDKSGKCPEVSQSKWLVREVQSDSKKMSDDGRAGRKRLITSLSLPLTFQPVVKLQRCDSGTEHESKPANRRKQKKKMGAKVLSNSLHASAGADAESQMHAVSDAAKQAFSGSVSGPAESQTKDAEYKFCKKPVSYNDDDDYVDSDDDHTDDDDDDDDDSDKEEIRHFTYVKG
jgi:hypothetical protein